MLDTYKRLVPLRAEYAHNAKYRGIPREENAHAHILNTLIGPSVSVPIKGGKLALGLGRPCFTSNWMLESVDG